jgi:hypothetical protein
MESNNIKCGQRFCIEDAYYRYTWPGNDESFICKIHGKRITNISIAMGFHVQMIPLVEKIDGLERGENETITG